METEFYRTCLKDELAERCERNPRYSTRAFAKALKINHGALSQILSGKRVPSYRTAKRLVQALGLSPEQEQNFLRSLALKHAGRNLQRTSRKFKGLDALGSPELAIRPRELSIDLFRVMSDWYHTAIMTLSLTEGFRVEAQWISRQLGITVTEARLALDRLLELGLLQEQDGKVKMNDEPFMTADRHLTTPALRKLQKQTLEKAIHSLENDPIEERNMTTMTMAIDPEKLSAAKALIDEFNLKLSAFLESGPRKQVYNLGICLYPLQKKEGVV